jgi:hypothetical protein
VSRRNLDLSATIILKVHPDMKAWVDGQAEADYVTTAEYLRRLIVADMRQHEAKP